jgi:hypothetical protein
VTIERAEMPPPPLGLWAAIVRFLVKLAFFSGMVALGIVGAYLLPDLPSVPDIQTTPLLCFVTLAANYCALFMLYGGLIGLGATVITAGRKPSWD